MFVGVGGIFIFQEFPSRLIIESVSGICARGDMGFTGKRPVA